MIEDNNQQMLALLKEEIDLIGNTIGPEDLPNIDPSIRLQVDNVPSNGYDFFVLKLYSDGNIDPPCELIGSSDATVTDTSVSNIEFGFIKDASPGGSTGLTFEYNRLSTFFFN